MLTSELVRAARVLLRWEQRDLAEAAEVSLTSVKRLESQQGALVAQLRTIHALQSALEAGGIQFIPESESLGAGLRLRRNASQAFIFDEHGTHVATITGSDIFDLSRNRRIGKIEGGVVYGLAGDYVGTLRSANTLNRTGSLTQSELRQLFEQA